MNTSPNGFFGQESAYQPRQLWKPTFCSDVEAIEGAGGKVTKCPPPFGVKDEESFGFFVSGNSLFELQLQRVWLMELVGRSLKDFPAILAISGFPPIFSDSAVPIMTPLIRDVVTHTHTKIQKDTFCSS